MPLIITSTPPTFPWPRKIEYYYNNEFCEWDDAVNVVVLSIFGQRYELKAMDAIEAKKFDIAAEDLAHFLQQLIDRGDYTSDVATKHLYKCMKNIFLPLCMYCAPQQVVIYL